jgi:hypothetical protein
MRTLVLQIPDELAADGEAEARRLKSTKAAVARARLAAGRTSLDAPVAGFELIADLVGTNTGAPPDLSVRRKDYLKATGFGREKPPR